MVRDIVHNLCESLVENIGGVAGIDKKIPPTPIIYLTQWRIVGNSEVHTDEYLTSWKVSGNSVVDNNTILSCGDLGQDGKYHVKISNGVNIYDIPLDAPLRKVNDVADTIEFPSETEGKALVTRPLGSRTLTANNFSMANSKRFLICNLSDCKPEPSAVVTNTLVAGLTTYSYNYIYSHYAEEGIYGVCKNATTSLCISDPSFIVDEAMTQDFRDFIEGKEVIYELATPTTELVDAPQIEEAESYSMVISQGSKAVEWSDFVTE